MIRKEKSAKRFLLCASVGIVSGFINGFLGAGGGLILLWIFGKMNSDRSENAVRDNFASVVMTVLLLSVVSAVTYSHTATLDTTSLLSLAIPGMIGGIAGAYLTDRLDTKIIKLAFSIIIVIAGVNMVF